MGAAEERAWMDFVGSCEKSLTEYRIVIEPAGIGSIPDTCRFSAFSEKKLMY